MADPDAKVTEVATENSEALDELAFKMRTAGFCLECRKLVERERDGSCPSGHSSESVAGTVRLPDTMKKDELPQLVDFNWGAFFMPMVWGPANGLWAGLLCFPLWMFVDSVVVSAVTRNVWFLWVGAAVVLALTVLFMWWFARTSTIPAYLKLKRPMSIERFNKQQRVWAIVGAIFFVTVLGFATYYNLAIRIA